MAGQQDTEKTESPEKDAAYRMWPLLCAIIAGWGAGIACSAVWGRATNPRAVLLTAGATAIGALTGVALRRTKGMRAVSIAACIVIFAAAAGAGKFFASDSWIARSHWLRYEIGRTSFSYPATTFKERKVREDLLANGTVRIFSNENLNRYVCYMVYDFTDEHPELADTLESALTGMLAAYNATFVLWSDNVSVSDTEIRGRFAYTRGGKTYTGIAFAAADGDHYELLMFIPLRNQYSQAFMERIESEIQ
ncbi:MAG TPA: hypothetical protein DDW78_04800 [Treponema sp.]|nr:hypothetical protein [Treponema sp.]